MIRIIFHILVNVLIVLGLSNILSGFKVDNISAAIWFLFILTLLNWTIIPLVKILTLPLSILTLGLFSFFINLVTVIIVANATQGIHLYGNNAQMLWNAFIISFALALGNSLANLFSR